MATSNYDVNLQLALATTAEHEGDVLTALGFLAEAQRLATDRLTRARVLLRSMRVRMRIPRPVFAL